MKKIEAIIRERRLHAVKDTLQSMGVGGMTITEVKGHGKQKGVTEVYRGKSYEVEFIPKLRLDVIVEDKDLDAVIKTISEAAKTGEIGDGKIFVTNIENVVRIRTGETGDKAV